MAAVNELPFGQYYGGVDTTPLFVMLAAAYAQRTADANFIDSIWSALVAATSWIESNMARHGGFLAYARGETTGLANQGWKDSHDSVFHEDGSSPVGPIALVEVQGYAYAALGGMAALASRRADEAASSRWASAASALAARVEQTFWQEDLQFYALALDGEGKPCRVRASNAGHLLFSGLPSVERGGQVARQLLSGAFDSGWGTRTLPLHTPRFNPMSYHNGSIWPHDVALCAAGVARYGNRGGAVRLLGNLFEAAAYFGLRLPELFCGFKRASGESPIAYPVACLPQAWAAGSVFMLMQSCLGIEIDAQTDTLLVNRPLFFARHHPHGGRSGLLRPGISPGRRRRGRLRRTRQRRHTDARPNAPVRRGPPNPLVVIADDETRGLQSSHIEAGLARVQLWLRCSTTIFERPPWPWQEAQIGPSRPPDTSAPKAGPTAWSRPAKRISRPLKGSRWPCTGDDLLGQFRSRLPMDDAWIKSTPAINVELCQRFGLLPFERDGRSDSLYACSIAKVASIWRMSANAAHSVTCRPSES